MIRLNLCISLGRQPRCPVCQRNLNPHALWVVDSLTFCKECANECLPSAIGLEVDYCLVGGFSDHYSELCGLRFFTPPDDWTRGYTAAQSLYLQGHGSGLAPASSIDLAGKRRSPLNQPLTFDDPPRRPTRRRLTPRICDASQPVLFQVDDALNVYDTHRLPYS